MCRKQDGYTAIELIITLSLVMLLLSIVGSISYYTYERSLFQQFIQQWNQDLLYIQQTSMVKNHRYQLVIHTDRKGYSILESGYGKKMIERKLPASWSFQNITLTMPIQFSRSGKLNNPGSFTINGGTTRYQIVCPFGSGRCYHAK